MTTNPLLPGAGLCSRVRSSTGAHSTDSDRQCTKAGKDCVFFDHGRNEFLPRTYIAELVDHVRQLSGHTQSFPSSAGETLQDSVSTSSTTTIDSSMTIQAESVGSDQPHYDHHFAFARGSYRYVGAESCLVKSPRIPQSDIRSPVPDDSEWEMVCKASSQHVDLVRTYLNTMQPLYPILDPRMRFLAPQVPLDLSSSELFCLNMVYSIGCYLEPSKNYRDEKRGWQRSGKLDFHHRHTDRYRMLAAEFFKKAQRHLEASTMDTTFETLRAVLLLAINSLFDPKTGNIGQQVALATRLVLSLEAKAELQELRPEDAEMLHHMHMTIFRYLTDCNRA
jgi:hypothetical protein